MAEQPTLETSRLLLRPLAATDIADLVRMAGRREIADTTGAIPHPYSEEQCRQWLSVVVEQFARGDGIVFGIVLKSEGKLVGTIGFRDINPDNARAEMGYWMSVECWSKGYTTEAAQALLTHGFEQLGLNRIYAHHMLRNPASGRVLAKIGMRPEGILRQQMRKWGVFEDVAMMAILKSDWKRPA